MTDAEAPDPARLAELATLTREYARYSRSVFGLAGVLAGGWLVAAAGLLSAGFVEDGWNLVLLAPLVAMALVVAARRYYQRHGEVVEDEPEAIPNAGRWVGRAMGLSGVYVAAVVGLARWIDATRSEHPTPLFPIAIFVAWTLLAPLLTRGASDASFVFSLCLPAAFVGRVGSDETPGAWSVLIVATYGALPLVAGVRDHLRYQRLERRLAALKGTA